MKSLLAAATHYCTLLCLSQGDRSLSLFVCVFVSLDGWLAAKTPVCHWLIIAHIYTLILPIYLAVFFLEGRGNFVCHLELLDNLLILNTKSLTVSIFSFEVSLIDHLKCRL